MCTYLGTSECMHMNVYYHLVNCCQQDLCAANVRLKSCWYLLIANKFSKYKV